MVRFTTLRIVAISLFLLGAEASPCRPATTAVTSLAETSSTVATDTTATSLDATTVTTLEETTTTVRAESTTVTTLADTTQAESTTTVTSLEDTTTTIQADSSTVTTLEENTSTVQAVSTTTVATVDTTTTAQADSSTVTTLEETTSTVQAVSTTAVATVDTTTTAHAESTTTTAAPACVETQLFINPNFDDNAADTLPWVTNGFITKRQPQSPSNALSYTFVVAGAFSVKQTLSNLAGSYSFSYYYRVLSVSQDADYTCDIELNIGDTSLRGEMDDSVGGWKSGSRIWSSDGGSVAQQDVELSLSCSGEFDQIQVSVDSLAFTRVCSV